MKGYCHSAYQYNIISAHDKFIGLKETNMTCRVIPNIKCILTQLSVFFY